MIRLKLRLVSFYVIRPQHALCLQGNCPALFKRYMNALYMCVTYVTGHRRAPYEHQPNLVGSR